MARSNRFLAPQSILIVLIILVLAGAVFGTYQLLQDGSSDTSSANQSTLESDKDIEEASRSLDSDQLESGLEPTQLDEDLNDLL